MSKNYLVTGANKGIGLACVEAILEKDDNSKVLLGSRDLARGEAAKAELVAKNATWSDRIVVLELDVSSESSVVAAVEATKAHAPLAGLLNNAGVAVLADRDTVVGVNWFGLRRVTEAFLPLLEPKAGRVVFQSSAAGPNYVNKLDDADKQLLTSKSITRDELDAYCARVLPTLSDESNDAKMTVYGFSKALVNAYNMIVARENPDLIINACTPGFIETDLTRELAKQRGSTPQEMGMKTPAEGTKAAMHLLFADGLGSGKYYGSDALRSPIDRYRGPGDPEYVSDSE